MAKKRSVAPNTEQSIANIQALRQRMNQELAARQAGIAQLPEDNAQMWRDLDPGNIQHSYNSLGVGLQGVGGVGTPQGDMAEVERRLALRGADYDRTDLSRRMAQLQKVSPLAQQMAQQLVDPAQGMASLNAVQSAAGPNGILEYGSPSRFSATQPSMDPGQGGLQSQPWYQDYVQAAQAGQDVPAVQNLGMFSNPQNPSQPMTADDARRQAWATAREARNAREADADARMQSRFLSPMQQTISSLMGMGGPQNPMAAMMLFGPQGFQALSSANAQNAQLSLGQQNLDLAREKMGREDLRYQDEFAWRQKQSETEAARAEREAARQHSLDMLVAAVQQGQLGLQERELGFKEAEQKFKQGVIEQQEAADPNAVNPKLGFSPAMAQQLDQIWRTDAFDQVTGPGYRKQGNIPFVGFDYNEEAAFLDYAVGQRIPFEQAQAFYRWKKGGV